MTGDKSSMIISMMINTAIIIEADWDQLAMQH